MSNAFSYLSGILLNEKMSATERKIGEAKSIIKNATESLKAREEEFKGMTDKKSQTAQHVERSIEHWKKQIESAEDRIKDLSRGIDNFKDHDPEELEKKFSKEKEREQHSKNYSKMSDDELKAAAEEHQQSVDELGDDEKKVVKDDPKHLSIQKELKKRQMQKIEIKKVKEKATETEPQQQTDDPKEQDPSKPTENPDNPNLPDPPANMTDGDNENGGKEELPTDEKGWEEHKKNVEKEREAKKAKHFSNWTGEDLKPGVDPKQAEADEKSYDAANKKNIATQFAHTKWRQDVLKQKAAGTYKEEPKVEQPKEQVSKYKKIDNFKDWDRVLADVTKEKEEADANHKNLLDDNGEWKEDVSDEEKTVVMARVESANKELDAAKTQHEKFKDYMALPRQKMVPDKKPFVSKLKKTNVSKDVTAPESKEASKEPSKKLEYKGSDESHPLKFNDFEEFKQHHKEKAEESEHPTEYGDAVKHIKKVNKNINDLNDEIELNNKELADPKIKKEDKEAVRHRNKELAKEIKELHNSKKSHEKTVNKHEQDLSSKFYEQHTKKKELSDKLDNVVKNYREAETNNEKEKMQKLRSDFDELHGQLKSHLGEGPENSEGSDDTSDSSPDYTQTAPIDKIEDWEEEEGDSYSRSLAKKTGYDENKFKKEGTPNKVAKEVAKKTQWILNRLGSGLHIQDSSISDVVKNSPSRQALVANYEKLSEWRKQKILKKIKKPLEDHIQDMDDAIEDAEREVEKYETKTNLTADEKEMLKVAKKQLSALNKEQRSAKETYDKIIEKGDTKDRRRNAVNVDIDNADDTDNTEDAEIVSQKKNVKEPKDDETEFHDVKRIGDDESDASSKKNSVEYLKKISNDKSSDSEDHGKPIEGIDFKKNDEGEEENFEPGDKLQNAIHAAQGEIERLDQYDSSESESMKKSLEGAIEMGEKAIKSNEGIGYALKSLKNAYTKSKTIKESFIFLKSKTKNVNLIRESKEIEIKVDPFKYLKCTLRG